MNQAAAGHKYTARCIARLSQILTTSDYVWDRHPITNERIKLIPTGQLTLDTDSKLEFLKYLIYTEGYGG